MKKLLIGMGLLYLTLQLSLIAVDRLIATNRTTRLVERSVQRRLDVESASDH